MNIGAYIFKKIDDPSIDSGVTAIRQFLFDRIVVVFGILGLLAVVTGSFVKYPSGQSRPVSIFVAAYLPVICCYLMRKKFSYDVRVNIILLDLYVLAVLVLAFVGGLSGAGMVLMLCFTMLATILLGRKKGLVSIVMGGAAIAGVGWGMVSGQLPIDPNVMANSLHARSWVSAGTLFLLVSLLMVLGGGLLLNSLQDSIDRLQEKKNELEDTNRELEKAVVQAGAARENAFGAQSLLEAALESTADGILIEDLDRRWTAFNRKFVRIWSMPEALLEAKAYEKGFAHAAAQLKHPEMAFRKIREIGNDRQVSFSDTVELKDGQIIEIYSHPQVLSDRVVGRVWSFRDVTLRCRAEQELKESEEYHKGLFKNSPMAMYIQDFSGVEQKVNAILEKGGNDLESFLEKHPDVVQSLVEAVKIRGVNQAALDMYQAENRSELIHGFHRIIPESDRQHFIDQVVALAQGKDRYEGEGRNLDLKGNTLEIILRKVVINREKNGLSRILVSAVDVTALHQANQERSVLKTRLLQAQKMETIGTLAGGIAHDFNNILFPIMGHAELILSEPYENEELRESINEIYSGALRASALVRQILTFSRKEPSMFELITVQHILKEVLNLSRSAIPATIEIRQEIDRECGPIKADPTEIHQIAMNLVTNAYQAMEGAAGVLGVYLQTVTLGEFDMIDPDMVQGQYLCLGVSDTGTGIPEDELYKIFDPFYTTKEKGRGTGMGLSVVHGIVKKMGGAVKVYSQVGQGTEFKVYLPAAHQGEAEAALTDDQPVQGGYEHILIVDDEKSIIDLERRFLTRIGYAVSCFYKSAEAFEAFAARPGEYDLLISDVSMPGLSGDKLAREILKIRPDLPVILCSGFTGGISDQALKTLGVRAFLMKPLIMKDLAYTVRQILDEQDLDQGSVDIA